MSDYIDDIFGPHGVMSKAFGGYEPRPGQMALAKAVDQAFTDKRHLMAEGPTGCHAPGQGILMYDGLIRKVENIRIGDLLMGPDSTPRTVLGLCHGRDYMVDVIPTKGDPWRVNQSHILTLVRTETRPPSDKRRPDYKGGEIIDVPITQWNRWSGTQKHIHKLFRVPVDFPEFSTRLTIPPYSMGVLLGDGGIKYGATIHNTREEILQEADRLATLFGLSTRDSRCARHIRAGQGRSPNHLMRRLGELGLLGCGAGEKFIPFAYKCASRSDRLQLFAGLMDTDGSADRCMVFDYVSKSHQLATDVAFVARSLGFAAYVSECEKTCPKRDGSIFSGRYFRVCISGNLDVVPTRLKPIAARQQKKSVLRTGFLIRSVGEIDEYFGFVLDGDGRYLLDDFTVTHNTGKSLAYCVPAVYHAVTNGRRIAVVTANIALQEQLHTKDLPMLDRLLPWRFKHSLIKGRSNYLCVDKWQIESAGSGLKSRKSKRDRDQYRAIMSWARRTGTGDMSELAFVPQPAVWRLFSSTSDECKGQDCRSHLDCFAERAHEEAAGSHVFVTNYHLLFAHLQVRMRTGMDLILPEFDVVVCDEAHKAADIARDFFGFRIVEGSVRFASRLLGKLGMNEEYDAIDSLSTDFFGDLKRFRRSGAYRIRFRSPPPIGSWRPLRDALLGVRGKFVRQAFALMDAGKPDEKAALMRAAAAAGKLADNIEAAMTMADPEAVYYIDENPDGSAALMGKPVFVAPVLSSELFAKTRSVVATSATLAVGGGFAHTVGELGMPDPMTLVVDSPFDFARQAIMVVPEGMPDAASGQFPKAVAEAVERTIGLSDGRALCLFTSYRNLEEAWKRVSSDPRHRILKQGDKPRTALIEEFRSDIHSVLLGTESFWAGVDVPGEALSCVVIDRLPFQTPCDPILDAIAERDEDWFMSYSVPKAVIAFKQGFGRLIRRITDRGVVVVLDRRLVTKPYGRRFLLSIPDVRRSRRLESVKVFLDKET